MRRFLPLGAVVLLAYAALTLLLWPHSQALLPDRGEAPTVAAAALELAQVPAEAPLSLIAEPEAGVGFVANTIEHASTSVDLVIYELDDPQVEQALADAHAHGVAVRVILDNLNSFGRHPNQAAYDFFTAHRVPVKWSPSYFALTHQKTLVIDGVRAYLMTFNLTPRYYGGSRDFAVVDDSPADVAAVEAAFTSDWSGSQVAARNATDLVWSPGSANTLLALIASASSTLDIYNEEMADPRITAALKDAAARGVVVRVDMTYATNWKQVLGELVAAHVGVRTYASTAKLYIHAKVVVADRREAFVGSENFSSQSLDQNRELGILISRSDIIDQLETIFDKDWAAARAFKPK